MIRKILLTLFFTYAGPLAANGVMAPDAAGIVHLRGALVNATCSVVPKNQDVWVDMGQYRSNQFSGAGSYTGPVSFSLYLNGCIPAVRDRVTVTFTGRPDDRDPQVFRAGEEADGSTGVGLAIFDSHDNLLPPGQPSATGSLSDREDSTEMRFVARYRATSAPVSGGRASSQAWFMLDYP